jgi:hypothetical protein
MRVMPNTTLLEKAGPITLHISADNAALETRRLTQPGWQTLTWSLPPGPGGSVRIAIQTEPPFKPVGDPRTLGIPVGNFGFR